jgi:hypothetical protein
MLLRGLFGLYISLRVNETLFHTRHLSGSETDNFQISMRCRNMMLSFLEVYFTSSGTTISDCGDVVLDF